MLVGTEDVHPIHSSGKPVFATLSSLLPRPLMMQPRAHPLWEIDIRLELWLFPLTPFPIWQPEQATWLPAWPLCPTWSQYVQVLTCVDDLEYPAVFHNY